MTTFIHEEMHRSLAARERSRDYDARIIVGFGVVMIAVATLVVAVGYGIDHTAGTRIEAFANRKEPLCAPFTLSRSPLSWSVSAQS
jgi:hypothetical protein